MGSWTDDHDEMIRRAARDKSPQLRCDAEPPSPYPACTNYVHWAVKAKGGQLLHSCFVDAHLGDVVNQAWAASLAPKIKVRRLR